MELKQQTERALKHYLKRKIAIVAGLLVSFLITGNLGHMGEVLGATPSGSAVSPIEDGNVEILKDDLLARIAAQKAEIETLLAENEAKLRDLRADEWNLVRKADYYSKPVYPSSQILMLADYENAAPMKDRTRDAFSQEIGLVSDYLRSVLGTPAPKKTSGLSLFDVVPTAGGGNISGLSPELIQAYSEGRLSAEDLAEILLRQGNGAVAVGDPHEINIDLGVNITLLRPEIPVVSKSVNVAVSAPSVPTVSVTTPTPNVPAFAAPSVTVPTVGAVTIPTVNLSVDAPEAVPAIAIASVTPTAPAAVSLSAPSVNISVVPPNVTPNMTMPPVVPGTPDDLNITIAPSAPATPAAIAAPDPVATPVAPANPTIVLFTPPNVTFNGTGFGQPTGKSMPKSYIVMQNYATYNTDGITIISGSGSGASNGTSWTGTVTTETATTLTTGTSTSSLNAFISHVDDRSVDVNGNYDFTTTAGGYSTKIFISLNPYETGRTQSADTIFNFAGTLTMHGNGSGTTESTLGIEHQLLARGPGGNENFVNILNGTTTNIFQNSGTIDLNSGTNLVGIQIDTEYSISADDAFWKQPQTTNWGTITIGANAQRCIAVDYGWYMSASPNSKVWLGNITVDGTNNYGFRMKDYASKGTPAYYNLALITGKRMNAFDNSVQSGNIQVNGSENVGMAIFMGPTDSSTATTTANTAMAREADGTVRTYDDPSDIFSDIHITVGGDKNVGFFRNFINNPYAMHMDGTKIEALAFAAGATNGALLRSDNGEIILEKDLNLTAGSTGNTAMQAGGTGIMTLAAGHKITSSLPTFYGMTAGDFVSTTGAVVNNNGEIELSGANSLGIAVATGNTGNTNGNITVSGAAATAVFNKGTATISGGTITAKGANSTGVYHTTGATTTISNTDFVANAAGAVGVYNASPSGMTMTGGTVSATGTTAGLATGIYNSGTFSPSGVAVTAGNYGVGVYNSGTMTLTNGSITSTGNKGIGLYAKAGSFTLTSPTVNSINAPGANSTGIVYEAGSLTLPAGFTMAASGQNALAIYNLGPWPSATATPPISLSGQDSTAVYNASTGVMAVTGNITSSGAATEMAGVFNAGTMSNIAGNITIHNGKSTAVYNKGAITAINGNIDVAGTSGNTTIGIYNDTGYTITAVNGNITTGSDSIALYNKGTITIAASSTITASVTTQLTAIYNSGAGNLTINGNIALTVPGQTATGIYNDSTNPVNITKGTITLTNASKQAAGLYHAGTAAFTFGGTGSISASGEEDAGIFNVGTATGSFTMSGGTVSVNGLNNKGSAGVYNKGTNAKFTLSGGTITANNLSSAGIFNEGTVNLQGGAINTTGENTTGIYNKGASTVLNVTGGAVTTDGYRASAVYNNEGTIHFNDNSTITAKQGATGLFTAGGTVSTAAGKVTTINVTNTLADPTPGAGEGLGVYATYSGTTGANVDLSGAKITVVGGSSAVASKGIGAGAGTTNLNLTGATVDYDGEGYAVYSDGQYGKINMTNSILHLRGKATGVEIDYSATPLPITLNNTNIHVHSANVTLANIKDYTTTILVSNLENGIAAAIGSGVTITDYTSSQYIFGRMEGGALTIDVDVDRLAAAGTPGNDYYKRFNGQKMKTTVNSGVTAKAVMTTAQATADYNNQVIGLEANSSTSAANATDTQVILLSGATVEASRTDNVPSGQTGAVGIYVNYGKADIASGANVKVQQGADTLTNGVGVFAVNGGIVDNKGTIKVAGPQAIGILGKGYRTSGGANTVGAEFGTGADQGKITISNSGTITMDSAASIGIYADNNTDAASLPTGTPVRTAADDVIANTGTITVASGTSSTNMSVGMAGSKVTLKNSGTITTGDYGVGIYGENGAVIDAVTAGNLGTIKVGGNSVAIMGTGSTFGSGITTVTLQSDNTTLDKIGIMYKGNAANVNFDIDGSAFKKGTVIYLENPGAAMSYGSGKTMKVGQNGVGIYLSESVAPASAIATNAGNIQLLAGSTKAVGLYTDGGTIANTGTITIADNSGQVGMFASGTSAKVNNTGIIDLTADKGTGVYLESGAQLVNGGTVNFGTASEGIGVLLDGASADAGGMGIYADNSKQNLLIYAQDKGTTAAAVTNSGTITVDGVALPASGTNKTIGVYLKRNSLQNSYSGGTMNVSHGALGVYSAGNNKIDSATIDANGKGSVALYLDGAAELAGDTIKARGAASGESVIGVYAKGGVVTITTGLNLETGTASSSDYGTGMYLTDGATVSGAAIAITNRSSATNVGLYYKGTSGTLAQGTDISLAGGNLVGLYVDGGVTVTNAKGIVYSSGSGLIGAYVSGGSAYTSSSTTDTIGTAGSAGILAGNGTGTNNGTLTVNNGGSAAMAALAKLAAENAKVVNNSGATINVTAGAGLIAGSLTGYAGTAAAENKGNVNVAAGGVGAAVSGANATFNGTGGTINANGSTSVGLYLEETGAGQVIALGNIATGAADAIGVYANKADVDFDITLGSGVTQGIGLLAKGSAGQPTVITGDVDASASTGTLGVFVNDQYVSFSGSTIKSGNVGLYVNNMASYTLSNVSVEANGSGVVGIYTKAANLTYSATTTTSGGGIGIYVPTGATIDTSGGVININGASTVGILLDGGTGNLGVAGTLTMNFGPLGGMGVLVKNGGTLTIGPNLTLTGTGTLAAVENSSLSNGGTISVNGSTALLGNYTSGGPYTLENLATGTINVSGGGVGIAALGNPGAATVTVKNDGTVNVTGQDGANNSSVGLYSTLAKIENNSDINVGAGAIGIFADGTNQTVSNNGHIVLNGAKAIGMIVKGATAGVYNASTTIAGGDDTVGIYLDGATGTVDAGAVTLGDDSVGVYANGGTVSLDGTVTVGDKNTVSPIGLFATNGASLSLAPTFSVTGGDGVIAIGADGASISGVDTGNIVITPGGVQLYTANSGSIAVSGSGVVTANDNVGLMINGSGSITGVSSIDVYNGGIGAYFIGNTATIPTVNVYDGVGGSNPKYSIGLYLSNISGAVTLPAVNQIGSYTIGVTVEDGTTASIPSVSLTGTADHQIGLVSKGTATNPNNITIGSINVSGAEDIGVYGEETNFTTGNVTVGDSPASADKSKAAIGLYASGGSVNAGTVTAGKNSIGVYGSNINPAGLTTQAVTADDGGIGLYATGTGGQNVTVNGDVTAGKAGATGVYGKNVNISVTGDLAVGEGTSVGIVSEGAGNVSFTGDVTIADKGASTGSIGLYKAGSGTITTSNDAWTVGQSGYGLYVEETGGSVAITNNADMTLGTSAVGVYAKGNASLDNYGDITVGATDLGPGGDHGNTKNHKNSAGIYLDEGASAVNYGTITADKDHSVGVYLSTGTYFENAAGGVINVDNGGVGVLAKNNPDSSNPAGGTAVNNGTINVGNNMPTCGNDNVGMAAYAGSTATNGATGTINVYRGVALYAGNGGVIDNLGTINIYTAYGTGVAGNGTLLNQGAINLIGGAGKVNGMGSAGTLQEGSVIIDNAGIQIYGNYVSVGGVLRSDLPIVLNGPYVDITHFDGTAMPLFTAPDITGTIYLTPNFATLGNGYAYEIDNFINAVTASGRSKITIKTSPMFIARELNGSLYVAKKPYGELVTPGILGLPEMSQFKNLYEGLDKILYSSDPDNPGKDATILKGLNAYLEQVFAEEGTQSFNEETARTLSETRGDIYATIQTRMRHVENAFDRSFEELLNAYNVSKDSNKYAVIHRQGTFRDDTVGIDDYDYRTEGLVYMKEHEGRNYGNKWGWTLGFAVSRFDFDDTPNLHDNSKEDVYSVRAGLHFVRNLSPNDNLRLITRAEAGYNRHEAVRSLELGDIRDDYSAYERLYKNKGSYDTWQFSLDNKLEKTVYRSDSAKVEAWAGVKAEYGKSGRIREHGDGLEVEIKGADYVSVAPEVGISAQKRAYIGKKTSLKLQGSLSYSHELGDFYGSNKARLVNGGCDDYNLIHPEKEKGAVVGNLSLTIEKANKLGVSFDVQARKHTNKDSMDLNYGVRVKYVF
jgi:hypothetical protein